MNKDNNFNILKFSASILVMVGHASFIFGDQLSSLFLEGVHSLGIKILFLISGYLITLSFYSNNYFLKYFIKRVFRIFPALIMYCIIVVFIIGPIISDLSFGEYFSNQSTYDYLVNMRLYVVYYLPGVFTNNIYPITVNGSLWSLPVEFILYFLLPVILIICNSKSRSLKSFILQSSLTILCIALQFLSHYNYIDLNFTIYNILISSFIDLVPWYLIGSLYTYPFIKEKLNIQIAFILLILLLMIQSDTTAFYICKYVFLSYAIFSFALVEKPIFKDIFNKYELSYGMYLYGFFVQQLLVDIFLKLNLELNYSLLLFLSIFITSIFALFSNITVEKQANKLLKKCLNSKLFTR